MTDEQGVDAELFGSLFVLMQHISRRADDEIGQFGLTSRQWLLLAVIAKAFPDSSPTLSEAAALYGTSRQNVKQIAAQLEQRGWLQLEADPADGRATRLVLTDRISVFADPEVEAEQAAFLDDLFAALSPRERRTLRDLVTRCLAHLSASPADRDGFRPTDARGGKP